MIYREKHKDKYFALSNDTARDKDLSDGAFRLLVFMLSMSDDWSFSVKGLAFAFNVSEGVIKYRLKELKRFGYVQTKKVQNKSGHFGKYDWDVFEVPNNRGQIYPTSDKTEGGNKPTSDKTEGGKIDPIRNTNIKERPIKEEIPKGKKAHAIGIFQNVFLTDSEQKELFGLFSSDDVAVYIDRLSVYLNQHPEKAYKNHKTTIKNWIIQDKERKIV